MDIAVIRNVLIGRPFRPFVSTMNDGREFEIFHPDWIFLHPGHVTIVDEGNRRIVHLEPILIATISVDDSTDPISSESFDSPPKSEDS